MTVQTPNDDPNLRPASFLQDAVLLQSKDPASDIPGMARNFSRYPVVHTATFQSYLSTGSAKVYRDYDEAVKTSLDNARYMRNDCGIMECLEARQRMVALLDWHIEPEDEKCPQQKEWAQRLTAMVERIRDFTEYRRVCQEAIWYGKSAIQNRYGWVNIRGRMCQIPTPRHKDDLGWRPIHGDKLVFRQDRLDLEEGAYSGQLGIRVGNNWQLGDLVANMWKVEQCDRGMAYFLRPHERDLLTVHRHMVEDAAYEDAMGAGAIHGVGIRSRIYWEWVQKQEALGFLMDYLERSAGGIEMWSYPQGNPQAKAEVEAAARNRARGQNVMLVPIPMGDEANQYGVQVVEPGMSGIETVNNLVSLYYGHRIKRYILGQVLSSEAEATGLGSGVADLHLDTLMQIIRYDARKLEETLTHQLLDILQMLNIPESVGCLMRFKLDTESPDIEKKLEAYSRVYEMGARIGERDVLNLIGANLPGPDDRTLSKQAEMEQQSKMQAEQQAQQGLGQPGEPDMHLAGALNQEIHRQMDEGVGPSPDSEKYRKAKKYGNGFDPAPEATDIEPERPHEFSSTQFNFEGDAADQMRKLAETIPDSELADDGRETEPHVTIKYGLHADEPAGLADAVRNFGPVTIRIGKISIFPANEKQTQRGGSMYDVVKIGIEGNDIRRLNKLVSDSMEHTDTFPDYQPHATLAYVKPGEGAKYVGDCPLTGTEFTFDQFVFSGKDRTHTPISLGGGEKSADHYSRGWSEGKHPRDPDNGQFVGEDDDEDSSGSGNGDTPSNDGPNDDSGDSEPKVSSRGNMEFEDAKSALLSHPDGTVLFQSAIKNGEIAGKMTDDAQRQSLTKIVDLMLQHVDKKTKLAYRSVMRHFEGHRLDDQIADEDPELFDELQADGTEKYARDGSQRWITLNGDSGSGTHVLVDSKGNIHGGPESLTGKNLDNLSGNDKQRRDRFNILKTHAAKNFRDLKGDPEAIKQVKKEFEALKKHFGVDKPKAVPDRAKAAGLKTWAQIQKRGMGSMVRNLDEIHSAASDALASVATRMSPAVRQFLADQFVERALQQTARAGNGELGMKTAINHIGQMSKQPDGSTMDESVRQQWQIAANALREHLPQILAAARGNRAVNYARPGWRDLYAKAKPAKGQKELRWITLGGSEEGDKKHVGGTPVQIDGSGNIYSGPDALRGKNLDKLKDDGEGRQGTDSEGTEETTKGESTDTHPVTEAFNSAFDAEFALARQSAVGRKKLEIENNDANKQGALFIGKDDKPGQNYLFGNVQSSRETAGNDLMNRPPEGGWTAADEVPANMQSPKDARKALAEKASQGEQAEKPEYNSESAPAPLADGAKDRRRKILQARAERGEELPASLLKEFEGEDWTKAKDSASEEEQQPTEETSGDTEQHGAFQHGDAPLRGDIPHAEAKAPGVSPHDVPYEAAYAAHRNTSFVPERRAIQRQNDYVNQMNADWEHLSQLAKTPEEQQQLAEEFERYRKGYLQKKLEALSAASRTASAMITGPARFPTSSNRKKQETEMRRINDLLEFRKRAMSAIQKKLRPEGGPIQSNDPRAVELLQEKLQETQNLQETMKKVNSAHARFLKDPKSLEKSDLPEHYKQMIRNYKPAYSWEPHPYPPYALQNNNANAKRIQQRIDSVSKMKATPASEQQYSGNVRVSEDPEAARIRIHFPGKPDRPTIDKLKSSGFRWSPTEGAWQRNLNNAGRYAVDNVLSSLGHEKIGEKASPEAPIGDTADEVPEMIPMEAEREDEPEEKQKFSRRLASDLQSAVDRYYRSENSTVEHPDNHGVTFAEAMSRAPASPSHPPAKNKPGWQHVGGSSVFVNADGKITKGCPGLKGEHVADLIDESDESRNERDARQAHAKARGLTGKDLTGTEAKRLGSKTLQAQHRAAKEAAKSSGVGTHHVLRNLPEAQERLAATGDPLEPARARARQLTGHNTRTLGAVENRGGGDSNSVANLDVIGQQLAEEFPELGWDMSDDNSGKVFDLIRQGKSADRFAPHSPEVAAHAAELAKQDRRAQQQQQQQQQKPTQQRAPLADPIAEAMQQEIDEWDYRSFEPANLEEEEAVPFSRTAQSRYSAGWNDADHPRGQPENAGEFAVKDSEKPKKPLLTKKQFKNKNPGLVGAEFTEKWKAYLSDNGVKHGPLSGEELESARQASAIGEAKARKEKNRLNSRFDRFDSELPKIHEQLTAAGFELKKTSPSGSRYYQHPDRGWVRVSDHTANDATQQWMDRVGAVDVGSLDAIDFFLDR